MKTLTGLLFAYLVNGLWQVPLVFFAAWLAARLARRSGPRAEHRVWVAALLLECILPACSFRIDGLLRGLWSLLSGAPAARSGGVQAVIGPAAPSAGGALQLSAPLLSLLTAIYVCVLLFCLCRLLWSLRLTSRMKSRAHAIALTGDELHRWNAWATLFHCESAQLAVSPVVSGPVTVGILRPVVLVPPEFLDAVSPDDLDAVLAHEFAHIQRRDLLKSLLFEAISLPIAFHPLLWLTRIRIAETRELVCDAMASEVLAGREKYARSLLRLARLLVNGAPARTLHVVGIFDAGILERRVMSLTKKTAAPRGVRRFASLAACAALGVATCVSALTLHMEVAQPATAQETGAARPVKVASRHMLAVYRRNPVYPVQAKIDHDTLDGPVVLGVIINDAGVPTHVRVIKSLRRDYDESALDAVREWRWNPYLLNGKPTAVESTVTVNYNMGR